MPSRFFFVVASLGMAGMWLRAADAPAPAPPKPVSAVTLDPKVASLLSGSAQYYAGRQSFEGDIASTTKVEMTGMKQEMDSSFHIALSRPNSFALLLVSGFTGGSVLSDGKTWITYVPILKKYTSTDAPAQLSDLLQPMNLVLAVGGLPIGIESLLARDPIKSFEQGLTQSTDLGLEKLGDTSTHHVRLVHPPYTTDLWIADGAAPFLLQSQVSMDMKDSMKNMSPALKAKLPPGFAMMSMVRTSTFTNWKTDQPVAAAIFQFSPPPDAKLVTEFVATPPSPLVGKPAPDFQLKDLEGKSVPLASLRGKVVVLDFWATWCGPCVASLPIVSGVAASFQDRGVVFYAANEREKPEQIRKFQADKNLAFPVLLDADGTVGNLYLAKAIPESVLIDKEGVVRAVHVGYNPAIKKLLTDQLDDLLAGKSLAAAPGP